MCRSRRAASLQTYQVEGETVVEAIFGYSNTVIPPAAAGGGGPGYGSAADRTVLLRWPDQMPDPVVRVGDWIADVTYERQQLVIYIAQTHSGRFPTVNGTAPAAIPTGPTTTSGTTCRPSAATGTRSRRSGRPRPT